MPRPLKTEAIKNFLTIATHKDLAALYNFNMEVQVLVAQDGGEQIEGEFKGRRWRGWKDNNTGETWKPFRIPWNANSEPEFTDSTINFDLEKHADGIGMTGWDWAHRASLWVAFDFDAISGHSEKHAKKLSESELRQVQEAVFDIPWVTIRRSTSGKGIHLYVFLKPTRTENHTEHQAIARAILGQMSGIAGLDFHAKVDACGGNMWVWHRKMKGTKGLEVVKQGVQLQEIPPHWRDHMKVVKGERRKAIPFFVSETGKPEAADLFEQMSGQRPVVEIDDEHKRLMEWIRTQYPGCSWWEEDHRMLVTHTSILKEAHKELQLRGIFETVAQGREKGSDHNAFCYPLRNGAWSVRRYSQGVAEAASWEQDGQGWTRCYLNREPDLATASRTYGGKEHPAGGFSFNTAAEASRAAAMIGADLNLPNALDLRKTRLKNHSKDGRLIAEVDAEDGDIHAAEMKEWINERKTWKRIFNVKVASPIEVESESIDGMIRHIVTEGGKDAGWVVKSGGQWKDEPIAHVKPALSYLGLKDSEIKIVLGQAVFKPWTIVNQPFQGPFPGDRQWNRNAAQFRFKPAEDENLYYPHWRKILEHCGVGLDDAIKVHPWAVANGIRTGADYLFCWMASLFKEPLEPLPYLFFYGEQDCGKSIFHEALNLLITNGYVRADQALTSKSNFNGELENALICVVEEADLKRDQTAYNKIKDWVTSQIISIHKKGATPYNAINTCHWIHAANSHSACPVFSGDTRITMVYVKPLDPMELIPKKELLVQLEKEAPHFLAACLGLELPRSNDRLNIPVVATEEKRQSQDANQSMLEMFIKDNCFHVTGRVIPLGEFYDKFREWLDPSQYTYWTKIRMGRELPPHHPKGRLSSNPNIHIGNISFNAFKPDDKPLPKLIAKDNYLVPIAEAHSNGEKH